MSDTIEAWIEELTNWACVPGGRSGRELTVRLGRSVVARIAWGWLVREGHVVREVVRDGYRGRPPHVWVVT